MKVCWHFVSFVGKGFLWFDEFFFAPEKLQKFRQIIMLVSISLNNQKISQGNFSKKFNIFRQIVIFVLISFNYWRICKRKFSISKIFFFFLSNREVCWFHKTTKDFSREKSFSKSFIFSVKTQCFFDFHEITKEFSFSVKLWCLFQYF